MMELNKRVDCYTYYIEDDWDRIEQLFFAKVSSQKNFKYNYEVLLINTTYKTNKYKMPLIVISGVISLNTLAIILTLHLFQKRHLRLTSGYLNASKISISILVYLTSISFLPMLRTVFSRLLVHLLASNILYLSHINKNVLVNYKKWFVNEAWKMFLGVWHKVLYASIEEVFHENWTKMKTQYGEHLAFLVNYQKDDIIPLNSKKVIQCFSNQIQYFGNTSISQSKSQNNRLKAVFILSIGKRIYNS